MTQNYRLLVIDDDQTALLANKAFFEDNGFNVNTANSGSDAVEVLKMQPESFAVILLDYGMQPMSGLETLKELLKINDRLFVVMLTGRNDTEVTMNCVNNGARGYILKNSSAEVKLKTIQKYCVLFEEQGRAVANFAPQTSNEKIIASVGLIGRSDSLAKTARSVLKYAPTTSSVLIRGESGTGKEKVAEALHKSSSRVKGPFVPINCAAISKNLIESELFGHLRGSFTGANRDKKGLFESANGGTIFLDEIGELDSELQAKLLRVLQERVIQPVGSIKDINIDVRVLSATHRNLEKMVEEGTFRQDLYYRLNVLSIVVEPLRERISDIEPLVALKCQEFNEKYSANKKLLARAIKRFEQCSWQGNVRELFNKIEAILIECPVDVVDTHHLSSEFFEGGPSYSDTFPRMKDKYENKRIKATLRALKDTNWNESRAAKLLGTNRTTLQSLIQKHSIRDVSR